MIENDTSAVAPLVEALGTRLREAGVLFCHWKSNATIGLAESGETDLDLLYSKAQEAEFREVLAGCGFVVATRPGIGNVPGTNHYFGYDGDVDKIIHVHAHDRLVVGHDRTKNFRIPIEGPFLASSSNRFPMPMPSPEFEYVLLCLRMVLKYAVLDEVVWARARGRSAGPSRSERVEFEHLAGMVDRDDVESIVADLLPNVGADLFHRAESFVRDGAVGAQRSSLARDLHSALADHARATPLPDAARRVTGRIKQSTRRRVGRLRKFTPADGGALVAVLGGDGAGKSTALDELESWLGEYFEVVRVHLGKPPWSITTYLLRAVLKVAGLFFPGGSRAVEPAPLDDRDEPAGDGSLTFPIVRRMLWFASKSRDRYLAYRRASAAVRSGQVVLSDRFPHSALRIMDKPQVQRLGRGLEENFWVRRLAAIESHYHRQISPPHLSVVLMIEPEKAAARKTDEPYDYVRRRSQEIWDIDWEAEEVVVIDASRPPEVVAGDLKALIWRYLTSR